MTPADPYHELRWWVTEANLPMPADMLPALTALLTERDTLADLLREASTGNISRRLHGGTGPAGWYRWTPQTGMNGFGWVPLSDAEAALLDGLTP